jgi:hypothetical protein
MARRGVFGPGMLTAAARRAAVGAACVGAAVLACEGADDVAAGTAAGIVSTTGAGAGGGGPSTAVGGAPTGGWGSAATGGEGDAGSVGAQGGAAHVTLVDHAGPFFTPTQNEPMRTLSVGTPATVYEAIRVEVDLLVGAWQPEIPDEGTPDRTEHIVFGLFRDNQSSSYQRYLMGSAAVTFATKAPHVRMFGRVTIGPGYTTYTQWSQTYSWQQGQSYHVDCALDGVANVQRCELWLGSNLEEALEGSVAYLDPAAHLSSGFYLQLGKEPMGEIETSPLGWTFSNLRITARLAP